MSNSRNRTAIGVVLTFLLWSAAVAANLHASHHNHLPIGRALLAGSFVGLAVIGLLTLLTTLWFLIFAKPKEKTP